MKKVNSTEMRKVEGGVAFSALCAGTFMLWTAANAGSVYLYWQKVSKNKKKK